MIFTPLYQIQVEGYLLLAHVMMTLNCNASDIKLGAEITIK